MKKLLFFCALFVALTSCSNPEKKASETVSDSTVTVNKNLDSIDFDKIDLNSKTGSTYEQTVSRLRGSNFIQKSSLNGDKANVIYYANFNDYSKDHPTTNLDEEHFKTYFDSEKTVKKTINSAVGKIFEKESSVNSVEVQKYYNGKNYRVVVSRKALEKNNFTLDNFSDKYVYDNAGRDKFYRTFKK